jgi:Ycf66 protein N-terminus
MLNFVFEPSTVLGLQVGISMILLYIIRFIYPKIAFDEDILLATLGLVYSCIIIVHGWRLDPILIFSQFAIVTIAGASGLANLKLRAIIFILSSELNLEVDYFHNSFLLWTKALGQTLKKTKNKKK